MCEAKNPTHRRAKHVFQDTLNSATSEFNSIKHKYINIQYITKRIGWCISLPPIGWLMILAHALGTDFEFACFVNIRMYILVVH